MARQAPAPNPKAKLTADQITRAIGRFDDRIAEVEAINIGSIANGGDPQLSRIAAAIRDTIDRAFGEGSTAADRIYPAAELQFSPMMFSDNYPHAHHYQEYTRDQIPHAIELLREAQRVLREDLSELEQSAPTKPARTAPSNKVFVVHGHDAAAKEGLARFIEKLGLSAVILSEQPNQGRTIIEKFEECAKDIGYAVVLLTPDDLGSAARSSDQSSRARQNVVFELGYFAGKLGRGRVCLLRKGDVEIPSDLYGVVYTAMDDAGGWKQSLVGELKAAKLNFDANRMWE